MTIKAVIWDMGGVILSMGDEAPRFKLAAQYNLPLDKIYWAIFDSPSAQQATVGELTIHQHWQSVAEYLNIPSENLSSFLRQFWSTDGIDHELIDFIRSLRSRYKIGLLSNAWDNLRQLIENEWQVSDVFEDMIISAEVGLAKPDPRIYRLAVERLGILPQEAVFIDDMLRNVQSAETVGLIGIQYQSRAQTLHDLEQVLSTDGQNDHSLIS